MDENLKSQIEIYLNHLDGLIRRGHQLRQSLAAENSNGSAMAAVRAWQEDCGATINQLSGGSKAHWLARSFSHAFLVRSPAGSTSENQAQSWGRSSGRSPVAAAAPAEIVDRLIAVLEQAASSLSQMDASEIAGSFAASQPPPRRFEFVHNPELRPVIEQAFIDSRRAFEQGRYNEALHTACGILEAIVTDAIEHLSLEANGLRVLASAGAPGAKLADWPFATRLAVAEKVGLIRGGCARLSAVARAYRDHDENAPQSAISDRDAQQAAQVLRVVMRDLDPGR